MTSLADEYFQRYNEFEECFAWNEHDDGRDVLLLIGEILDQMSDAHTANILMAAIPAIFRKAGWTEWDWSALSDVQITPKWREELGREDGFQIFGQPFIFDELHDLHAFAFYGILPVWQKSEAELAELSTDPRAYHLAQRFKEQEDVPAWVESVCRKVDRLEGMLPEARVRDGLIAHMIATRTAARARLKFDAKQPLTAAELAALSQVSQKRLQNAIYSKTDEAPMVSRGGLIDAASASIWLSSRDYLPSLWQMIEKIRPLKDGWGEDVEYEMDTPTERHDDFIFVPVANDGTEFLPSTCRQDPNDKEKVYYMIGPKGDERRIEDYLEALAELSKMDQPRWRRPNKQSGRWGIVTGTSWRRVRRSLIEADA